MKSNQDIEKINNINKNLRELFDVIKNMPIEKFTEISGTGKEASLITNLVMGFFKLRQEKLSGMQEENEPFEKDVEHMKEQIKAQIKKMKKM